MRARHEGAQASFRPQVSVYESLLVSAVSERSVRERSVREFSVRGFDTMSLAP